MPKSPSQTARIESLIQAVRRAMKKRGITADALGVETTIGYLKIKHWFAGSGFPKGEHALILLEWLTGTKIGDMIDGIASPSEERPPMPSTKSVAKDFEKYVEFNPANTGLKLRQNTPVESMFRMLNALKDHEGNIRYMIGDLLLQGREIYGNDRFKAASRGHTLATLRIYENAAKNVPAEKRTIKGVALDFSAGREVARLESEQQKELYQNLEKHVDSTGRLPNVRGIRKMSQELKPPRKKGPSNGK